MPRHPLTDAYIRSLQPPESGQVTITDATLQNFAVRVSQGGAKTFCVILGHGRRHTIGRYGIISLADARREARRVLAEKTLGKLAVPRTAFAEAVDAYITDCRTRIRPRTLYDYQRLLKRLPFNGRALTEITPRGILNQLDNFPPSEKHHAFTAARAFFRWCVRRHLIDSSPMENMQTPPNGKPRERVLSPIELKALYLACSGEKTTFSYIVSLLILTGQRRGEIARLEWLRINMAEKMITIPSEVAKNHRTHTFPYGSLTQSILDVIPSHFDSPYLFPSRTGTFTAFSQSWHQLKSKMVDIDPNISTDFVLHDLRRSYSSIMASLGVPQVVVEKLLNHVSQGTQSPISQVYNRYNYLPEMREAVLRYEAYLTTLIAPTA